MMKKLKYTRNAIIKTTIIVLLAFTVLCSVVPARAQNRGRNAIPLADLSDSLQQLASRISPSVVQITAAGYGLDSDSRRSGTP